MVELTEEQQTAYDRMCEFHQGKDPNFTLFGLAGTGKTTLLSRFAKEYDHTCLVTLTGKAAWVLQRKTGIAARTIHSFFYHLEEIIRDKQGREKELIFKEAFAAHGLFDALVLLDECSMVGQEIATDIKRTGARILACGDPGQLKPVKDVPYFTEANFELREIHRQALDSPIIRQAHRVRQGLRYMADEEAVQVKRFASNDDVLSADVLLCYTNYRRKNLNTLARRLRGITVREPQPGEPVMCRKNLSALGLYNGAVYTLLEPFNANDRTIVIEVEGQPMAIAGVRFEDIPSTLSWEVIETWFSFGYACTVHKAAGSEWPRVALYDEYVGTRDDRSRWLYTGITRAADSLTIITG